jgi:hypothetical protein
VPKTVLLATAVMLAISTAACGHDPASESAPGVDAGADRDQARDPDASVATETDGASGADALVPGDAPTTCPYHAVVRAYIENEFCTGYVSDPSLCVPYRQAYDGAADGVTMAVEERWFAADAPLGSDAYVVRETYHLVTFVKPAGTSLIAVVNAACQFAEMTYLQGGPGTYPWVSSDEALGILSDYLEDAPPTVEPPRLVWYPAPECGYSFYFPCWYLETTGDPATHWFVNQLGEVYTTVVRPPLGGGARDSA